MLSPSVLRVWFHTSVQAEDAQLSARLSYGLIGHLSNALEHFCSAVLALSREQLASPPSWALRLNQASLPTAALPIAAPFLCATINSASPCWHRLQTWIHNRAGHAFEEVWPTMSQGGGGQAADVHSQAFSSLKP